MNHLANEKSPYLLQHADNPVDWYPWDKEALDKARREDKPVFLSIGYSTCHWCHVMAHESFEDEEIAKVLNAHFVCIKVDREERPDIDHIYMTAITALTGQGGWPLSVFLTPDGKPFYGGTYFPPYAKWGAMGFKDLLLTLSQAWKEKRQELLDSADEITALLQRQHGQSDNMSFPRTPQGGRFTERESDNEELFRTAFHQISSQFDPQHGGLGHAPKFPMGHNLSFLLRYYSNTGEKSALSMVEQTLRAMGRGGIYDHLGGGFHRYATDQQWHVPHFEKMLYDQALLVFAYTEAYQITGNGFYRRIAEETLEYVLRDLTSPEGGFYCAEDADSVPGRTDGTAVPEGGSEGHEGLFYIWSAEEIQKILGEEAAVFNRYYGVKPGGNVTADPHGEFTGRNILFLAADIDPADEAAVAQARRKLFEHRGGRVRPHLDDKILVDWNGLMIAAFAFAGCAFNQPRYIDAARKAADFILDHCCRNGRLLHRWRKQEAAIEGMLEDYSFFVFGLVQLYEAGFQERYIREAGRLAGGMLEQFADPQGGFFMTASDAPGLITRPQDIYDGAIPSGNSVAAWVLAKLHYLTGEENYLQQSQAVFDRFMPVVSRSPHAYCFFLSALDFVAFPPVEITLTSPGGLDDSTIANIRKVVYKHFIPRRVLKQQQGKGAWSVNVCRGAVCRPAVNDLGALEEALK